MAYLASDVTAQVREHLSQFYPDSNPQALELVNEAHSTIVRECGLYDTANIDVSLVAGVAKYALSPDVFRIKSAFYLTSPNLSSGYRMVESSNDELDYLSPSWPLQTASQPSRYYEEGGMLGLYPTPNTTTLGGYPVVRLRVLTRNPITSLSSALPSQIPHIQAWVWQVCLLWALRNDDGQVEKFAALTKQALEDLKTFTQTKLVRGKVTVKPRIGAPRRI